VTSTKMTAFSTSSNVYGEEMTSMYLLLCALPLGMCIIDTFFIHRHVLTGSYHNYFRIYDTDTLNDVVLQADKSAFKAKKIGGPLPGAKAGIKNGARVGGLRDAMQLETLDFNKKILHASWHPRENTIAVGKTFMSYLSFSDRHGQIAATNNLFLYSAA
jgi:serine/threonine-protein phosphatase 2A regulatory subunit B